MNHKLEFDNLSVFYNSELIIDSLSGSFISGMPNIIVGRAGSGKTTLLKTIAGFHKEYIGKIMLDSADFKPVGNFSLAFQDPEMLFFNTTALDEVSYALTNRSNLKPDEIREKAKEWLKEWGLGSEFFFEADPLELSGGEKRRLALAACTIFLPPIIMLDEPLAGLDSDGQQLLVEILKKISEQRIVIIVTHEPELFLGNCSLIMYLSERKAEWFTSDSFISTSLKDNSFYPLQPWYTEYLKPFSSLNNLPPVNAEKVFEYIKNANLL